LALHLPDCARGPAQRRAAQRRSDRPGALDVRGRRLDATGGGLGHGVPAEPSSSWSGSGEHARARSISWRSVDDSEAPWRWHRTRRPSSAAAPLIEPPSRRCGAALAAPLNGRGDYALHDSVALLVAHTLPWHRLDPVRDRGLCSTGHLALVADAAVR